MNYQVVLHALAPHYTSSRVTTVWTSFAFLMDQDKGVQAIRLLHPWMNTTIYICERDWYFEAL